MDGFAITDHNTIQGALEVKKLRKDREIEVIVGEEVLTDSGELLVYYLNKGIPQGPLPEVLDAARSQGALVALAHPTDLLRRHFPAETVRRWRQRFHAVETFNSRTLWPMFNDSAFQVAKANGLARIAGSDAHFSYEIGGAVTLFHASLRSAILHRRTSSEGSMLWGPLGIAQTFLHKNFSDSAPATR